MNWRLARMEIANAIGDEAFHKMFAYLENHERDIASDINDYGDLKQAFTAIVGRAPFDGLKVVKR